MKFDNTVFDNIDTEEKAYWLGFIYADGYISYTDSIHKNRYVFEVSLKSSDVEHLNKLNKFFKCETNKVTINKTEGGYRCRLFLANKHLWEVLNSYGCTPRKSLTLTFPKIEVFKSKNLIRHFIRGYFDDDGCFSRNINVKTVSPIIGILGTEDILKNILSYSKLEAVIKHDPRHNNAIKFIFFNKTNGISFINYIYQNSSIYLNRKYKLYNFFKMGSRSIQEWVELQSGNIGESPVKDNPEINSEIKEAESSYSVENEPLKESLENIISPRVSDTPTEISG